MYSDSICLQLEGLYRVDLALKDNYLLCPNDILFVRSSLKREGVGWATLFSGHSEPVTFCGFLIRARLVEDVVNPQFLIYYLRLPATRDLLVSKSGKVAITNVNQEGISSLPIPVPPIVEQKAIAHTLQIIQQTKEARQRELEKFPS